MPIISISSISSISSINSIFSIVSIVAALFGSNSIRAQEMTWHRCEQLRDQMRLYSMLVIHDSLVLASGEDGVYASTDVGITWHRHDNGSGGTTSPVVWTALYSRLVKDDGGSLVFQRSGSNELWRSDDIGRSWRLLDIGLSATVVSGIVMYRNGIMFVGTNSGNNKKGAKGLLRSLDSGRTFHQWNMDLDTNPQRQQVDVAGLYSHSSGVLFVSDKIGPYGMFSRDYGSTWQKISLRSERGYLKGPNTLISIDFHFMFEFEITDTIVSQRSIFSTSSEKTIIGMQVVDNDSLIVHTRSSIGEQIQFLERTRIGSGVIDIDTLSDLRNALVVHGGVELSTMMLGGVERETGDGSVSDTILLPGGVSALYGIITMPNGKLANSSNGMVKMDTVPCSTGSVVMPSIGGSSSTSMHKGQVGILHGMYDVLITTDGGITYRSANGNRTRMFSGVYSSFSTIAIGPDDLLAGSSVLVQEVGLSDTGNCVFLSSDYGVTWNRSSNGIDPRILYAANRVVCYDTEIDKYGNIYASFAAMHVHYVPDSLDPLHTGEGLYVSTDRGASWVRRKIVTDSNRIVTAIVSTNDGSVYAMAGPRAIENINGLTDGIFALYRSTDAGQTWTETKGVNRNLFGDYFPLIAHGNRLYVANTTTIDAIYYSDDQGKTWTAVPSGLSEAPTAIDVAPDGTLYAATVSGLWYLNSDPQTDVNEDNKQLTVTSPNRPFLTLYPNPIYTNKLYLELNNMNSNVLGGDCNVRVVDITGAVVFETTVALSAFHKTSNTTIEADFIMPDLVDGVYALQLISEQALTLSTTFHMY